MKNLELWEVSVKTLEMVSNKKFLTCYNNHGGKCDLFIITHNLTVFNIDQYGTVKWSKDLAEISSMSNEPVCISYIALSNQLSIGLANGELYTIDDSGGNCDLAGVCETGILAMEWSPDQDLLILVTKEFKMITMSCTYDPITEENLLNQEFGDKQFINVGWGKKETQFHGSAGKQAAKLKKEIYDEYTTTDNRVKITWRGDGDLFAVGFVMNDIRRFKVFDREGQLQYTSEMQHGLESNLAWRPSGNLIATTQKLSNKYVVSFFEKNGLKHGDFLIPDNQRSMVEGLFWSSDSQILTLQCKNLDDNTQKLFLFSSSNYHWYLKQTLIFSKEEVINEIFWDTDFDVANNKKIHVILNNGKYLTYTWIWNICHGQGKNNSDDAAVAVIDGKKALVTCFRQTIVPPPMASLEIELESYIDSIKFAPPNIESDQMLDTNSFIVITGKKMILLRQTQKFPLQYEKVKDMELLPYDFQFQYYNWHWLKHDMIVCVMVDGQNCYHLVEFQIKNNELYQNNTGSLPAAVVSFQCHPYDCTILFMQLNSGDIMKYEVGKGVSMCDISFKESCPKFSVLSIDNDLYFLGLSHKGDLYMNGAVVVNNVSSYFVHTSFLLITTLQHFLLCTELSKSGLNALAEHHKIEMSQVYKRKIERGAKLIIAIPNATNTILQMPRGNIETIQPQPLSLKIIGKYLDSLQYQKAFDLMRKQRINLNLIHDHNPELFLQNINIFLDSIHNNSWLCLFLADLENVDITRTMYLSTYMSKKKYNVGNKKVHYICDIVQMHINKRMDCKEKILPLLTTFVRKNTIEDLEKALSLIKDIKNEETNGFKHPVGSDEALKYLLYMVDVNQLFDVALGMYDFDLVTLVATKSQKDPKEYIPMLNELYLMDENYKRFTINKQLKRFGKAVKCLANCGIDKHEELRTYVKYHSLYKEALVLFSVNDDIYKQISEDFGLHLKLKKQFVEAGIIYERALNYKKAIDCYRDGLEWELAISLSQQYIKEEYKELCCSLVNGLKDEKRNKEALIILEQFLDNAEDSIIFAIESGQFKSALRLCSQKNRFDLKDKLLLPAILEEFQKLRDLIDMNYCDFQRHRKRLAVVRVNKMKNEMEYTYDPSNHSKDNDLYSDAGSTLASSSGSGRTFRSSKNRRKQQRKIESLKEGSQYEDVALLMALHSLVSSSYALRSQVKEVNIVLMFFNKNKEALELQTYLEKLLEDMRDNFKEIWTNDLVIEATNAAISAEKSNEGHIPEGLSYLEPHLRIPPMVQDISWKLMGLN